MTAEVLFSAEAAGITAAMPRVAVVYARGSASPSDIAAAAHDLVDPVFVMDSRDEHSRLLHELLAEFGPVLDLAQAGPDAVVQALRGEVTGIVTFSESMLRTTAALAAQLGLAFHSPEVAYRLTDKGAQRRRLNQLGVTPVRQTDAHSRDDFARARTTVGLPVVVKPRSGQASADTHRCADEADYERVVATLLAGRDHDPAGWVVEEMLHNGVHPGGAWLGDYCSVESAVMDGKPWHYNITDKLPLAPPYRERGDVIPTSLPEPLRVEVLAVAEAAIGALEVRHGLVHTEVKLTPDGPKVIEVNGRLGGDISRLLRRVSQFDPVRLGLELAATGTATMADVELTGAAFFYTVLPPMREVVVRSLAGPSVFRAVEGVWSVERPARVGRTLDWRKGTAEAVFVVWAEAPDAAGIAVVAESLAEIGRGCVEYQE